MSDLARKRPYRGLVGYFIAGLLCLPKLLGAGLLMMLAALALFLALAVVFFICKKSRCWAPCCWWWWCPWPCWRWPR